MLKKVFCIVFLVFFAASMVNNAFAILIFSDGFESGSFSRWSGRYRTYGETASVVYYSIRRSGLYSAKFTSNGGGGYEKAYCYKNIPARQRIYVRAYFYVSRSGIVERSDRIFFIILKTAVQSLAYVGWKKNQTTGAINWIYNCRGPNYSYHSDFYSSYLNPHPGHWYCVELQWLTSDVPYDLIDELQLWINGHEIDSIAGGSMRADYRGISRVEVGLPQIYNCGPTKAYVDNVKIQTTYIGP